MDNNSGINIKDEEIFPNEGDKKSMENGKPMQSLQQSMDEVQGILERNRMLLQKIGQNHEAREADGLNHNVALFCELRNNMARLINLYSDLSSFYGSLANGSPVGTKGDYKEAETSTVQETDEHPLFYV